MGRAIIHDRYTKLSLTIYKSCCDITFGRFIYSLNICYSIYRRSCRRTGSINRKLVKNSASRYPKEVVETGCVIILTCILKIENIYTELFKNIKSYHHSSDKQNRKTGHKKDFCCIFIPFIKLVVAGTY